MNVCQTLSSNQCVQKCHHINVQGFSVDNIQQEASKSLGAPVKIFIFCICFIIILCFIINDGISLIIGNELNLWNMYEFQNISAFKMSPQSFVKTTWRPKKTLSWWLSSTSLHNHLTPIPLNIYWGNSGLKKPSIV